MAAHRAKRMTHMIRSLLVANRGEIACRILRTARRMGIRTIAVYSDADAAARHVREADTAIRIGPPPAAESYLDAAAILRAAASASPRTRRVSSGSMTPSSQSRAEA